MQPPNPAPVSRAPYDAGVAAAISTSVSSSGLLTPNRSRIDAWLAQNSRPTSSQVPGPERLDRREHALVLVHDVLARAARQRVHPAAGASSIAGSRRAAR